MAVFDLAIDKTLAWEGGYVDDPDDAGGKTKWGISKRAHPEVDIENLTMDDAKRIYEIDYWERISGDNILDQPAANALFDAAVNLGVRRAAQIAQEVVNSTPDGIIGPKTLHKLNVYKHFVEDYTLRRIKFYVSLAEDNPVQKKFLFGWSRRALSFL